MKETHWPFGKLKLDEVLFQEMKSLVSMQALHMAMVEWVTPLDVEGNVQFPVSHVAEIAVSLPVRLTKPLIMAALISPVIWKSAGLGR